MAFGWPAADRCARRARNAWRVRIAPPPCGAVSVPMPIRRHPFLSSSVARGIRPDDDLADRLARSAATLGNLASGVVPRFYDRLFVRAPHLRPLFPADPVAMGLQRAKLAGSLGTVVAHVRQPDALRKQLRDLGRRHETYGVRPEHYPIVVEELVAAMADIAGPAWTQEYTDDWTTALTLVCDVMQGK